MNVAALGVALCMGRPPSACDDITMGSPLRPAQNQLIYQTCQLKELELQ